MNMLNAIDNNMLFTLQELNDVKIFNLFGELAPEHEEELGSLLMKAIHRDHRAVLNLNNVTRIDSRCLNLIKKAYCASIRLKNPLIITEVPGAYLTDIYNCTPPDTKGDSISKNTNIAV